MTVKDIKKLITYWLETSNEDMRVARDLFRSKRFAYCLFFCHLAIEKMLKALVVAKTRDHAPWTHNLPFLAGKTNLNLNDDNTGFRAEMTRWNLEARYPSDVEDIKKAATLSGTKALLGKTESFTKWLKSQL